MKKMRKWSSSEKSKKPSIFEVSHEKPTEFKLSNNSTSMGFAAYLKEDYLGFELEDEQRSDVFMNCLIVSLLQFVCVFFVWIYALGPKF